uniref:SH3 domain-containing protein n=1 Tax=Macrostomum lignano TaxID=282301 RepID=A0A1I8J0P5_9PLAT
MASNGGLDSRKGSFSDETKAERAEIFLRYQAEKLQDRSKYKSVFYDRVGPEFEDPTARLSALQTSDSEGDLHENHGSAATTSATSVGATNNRSSALRLAEQSGNLSDESQQPQPQDQRGGELAGRLTSSGPSRTLWRNMPEVAEAGLLESLSKDEVKLKEAQFEFITSEASYYKNLLVLVDVFYNSSLFDHTRQNALVKALDKHHLFSNIVDIIECSTSQRLLHKLCENADFVNELGELEQRPDCRRIALQSYLEMPMKRVMSLQLLMDAVVRRMSQDDPNYGASMLALGQLLTLARECDQESRMMSEKEQMLKLQNQLIFTKKVGCWGGGRHLIREAQVRVISATPNTQGFVAKMFLRKNYLQLHAFSDLLIVSKPKSDQGFQVLKHCPRAYVDVEYLSNASYSTFDESSQKPTLRLRMVDSSDGTPPVSLVLEMPSREEAERWLMIFSPRDELGDPVYEPDDCPQAEAIRAYTAQQKDDLELRRGDIVNIYKKTEDGWYLGSRLTQLGHRGWFPANHVREIENEHYKAKLKKVSFRRKSAVAAYARHKHL